MKIYKEFEEMVWKIAKTHGLGLDMPLYMESKKYGI